MKLAYFRGYTMDSCGGKVLKEHKKLKVGKQYLIHTQSAWLPRGDGGHYPETWVEVYDANTSKPISKREWTSVFTEERNYRCTEHDLVSLGEGSPFKQCQMCFAKFQVTVKIKRLPADIPRER